jgi:hypothetical protein
MAAVEAWMSGERLDILQVKLACWASSMTLIICHVMFVIRHWVRMDAVALCYLLLPADNSKQYSLLWLHTRCSTHGLLLRLECVTQQRIMQAITAFQAAAAHMYRKCGSTQKVQTRVGVSHLALSCSSQNGATEDYSDPATRSMVEGHCLQSVSLRCHMHGWGKLHPHQLQRLQLHASRRPVPNGQA